MAGYFFDSSALVKRYHVETGTSTVDKIANELGAQIRISILARVELVSAFAIKVRTGAISREEADLFLQQFHADVEAGKLEAYPIAESDFMVAERLVEKHAFDRHLRALDASQLAVALGLRSLGLLDYFVAADQRLCEVAKLEGFTVLNPAEPNAQQSTSNSRPKQPRHPIHAP